MRTPIIQWTPPASSGRDCGNISCLSSDEVFTLKPGEARDLGPWIGFPELSGPGVYNVSVTYENVPELDLHGIPLGEHDEAAMANVRKSTPLTVTSNVVELVVEK